MDESRLGYGITTPFRRDNKSDFATAGGTELIRSHVGQLLGRRKGDHPWRMDSGNKLDILRHRRDNQSFRQLALLYVCEALAPEPSVRVEDVQRVTFDNPSAVGIRVKFMIIPLYSMDDVVAGPYEETVII